MNPKLRKFAPIGLLIALAAFLAAVGIFIVQNSWNRAVQISLGVAVIGLALFAALDPDRIRKLFSGRQARYGSNFLVLTIAFVGILVVINYLGYTNTQRLDLTEDKEFSLAPETQDVLEQLTEPVKVQAFYQSTESTASAQDLLEKYAYFSDGKLSYEFIDPDSDPAAAEEAGILYYGTIVFSTSESKQLVRTVSESEFTSALVRLMNPGARSVYFVTRHGEYSIEGNNEITLSLIAAELEAKNFTVSSINLSTMLQIPADAYVLVIASPTQSLAQAEIAMIDNYLEGGGALVVLAESPMVNGLGVEADLLAGFLKDNYGVVLGNDIIVDPVMESNFGEPYWAVSDRIANHAITNELLYNTFFPTARSITTQEAASSVTQTDLIFTADYTWAETDPVSYANKSNQYEDGVDLMGPIAVAVAVEDSTTGARVVVFGDAEFPLNRYYQGTSGNPTILLNSIEWAAGEEGLINLSSRVTTQRSLILTDPNLINWVTLGSIVIIPGLVVVGGISAWLIRRKRG